MKDNKRGSWSFRKMSWKLFVLFNIFATFGMPSTVRAKEKWHPCLKANHKMKMQSYVSPDGGLRATIVGIGKKSRGYYYESCVQIRTTHEKLVFQESYGSPDNEHGLGVVCVGWTPDSQFFVWSMSSSGGHQALFFQTFFYSRRLDRMFRLEDPTTTGSFRLKTPNVFKSKRIIGDIENIRFTVKLNGIIKQTGITH